MSVKVMVSFDNVEEVRPLLEILNNELPDHKIKIPRKPPDKPFARVYFIPKK